MEGGGGDRTGFDRRQETMIVLIPPLTFFTKGYIGSKGGGNIARPGVNAWHGFYETVRLVGREGMYTSWVLRGTRS